MASVTESDDGTKGRVKQTIKEIGEGLSDEVRKELEEIWAKIEEAAKDLCPIDTGALVSTIQSVESGGGAISATSMTSNEVFNKSLIAGDESVVNKKTGKSTAEYAGLVHDGHATRDGIMWYGVPFLTEALMMYEEELQAAIDKALKELQGGKVGAD